MSVSGELLDTPVVTDADMRLELSSHHIRVTGYNVRGREALLEFCRSLAQYQLERLPGGRFRRVMSRVYAGASRDRTFFHFHRHQLEELLLHLERFGFKRSRLAINERPPIEYDTVEFDVIDTRTARDYQEKFVNYIINPQHSNIVTLDPGRGKTFIFLTAMAILKRRTVLVIKPMYIEKWIGDFRESINLSIDDLMVVRGGKEMRMLTRLAVQGQVDSKIIIISNTTFQIFLKEYETYGDLFLDFGYDCTPQELYEYLKAGLRGIDEIHQDFHLNFRQDLYAHGPKMVGMSGSLESDDEFVNHMYKVMFPNHLRIDNGKRDIYVVVKALEYRFTTPRGINYTNHSRKSYSHVKFEQSMMKHKDRLSNYMRMIGAIVKTGFVKTRLDGQKMIVFAATIDFCTKLTEHLKRLFPELDVQRYVGDDDYEEMLKADLIVSTVKSLGTAIDVPDLVICLLTDALNSSQANIQCLGRLRRLKRWPDQAPVFMYLVNLDIPKHIDYHRKKMELFKPRVKSHKILTTEYKV